MIIIISSINVIYCNGNNQSFDVVLLFLWGPFEILHTILMSFIYFNGIYIFSAFSSKIASIPGMSNAVGFGAASFVDSKFTS